MSAGVISRKRKNRENVDLLLNGAGVLVTNKLEKAKAFIVNFRLSLDCLALSKTRPL